MTERVFSARLRVTDELTPALKGASTAARGLSGDMGKLGASTKAAEQGLKSTAKAADSSKSSFQQLAAGGDSLGKVGLVLAGGLALGVKQVVAFDKAMSAVAANSGATGKELQALRDSAIDLGAKTAFSSKEAAEGINEMAKAGMKTKDILGGGLQGALSLAAAGQMDVATAAEYTTIALTQFNQQGSQAGHVADLLAKGANMALGSVDDMGQALKQGGLSASTLGLSLEETTGTLALFAQNGLIGSDAGTSLKTMLSRLTPQSEEAAKKFKELGISAFDAQGNFIGMENVAGQLQTGMAKLSPEARSAALNVMFGSDAARAASILFKEGAGGVNEFTTSINDAGFAAKNAAQLQDNLAGDWEKFMGSIESSAVRSGGALNNALRAGTQFATGLVDALEGIPQPVSEAATGIAALTTGVLLTRGAAAQLAPSVASASGALKTFVTDLRAAATTGSPAQLQATATALQATGLSAGGAARQAQVLTPAIGGMSRAMNVAKVAGTGLVGIMGGPLGIALTAGAAALGFFAMKSAEAGAKQDELKSAVSELSGILDANAGKWSAEASKWVVTKAAQDGTIESLKQLGFTTEQITTALTQQGAVRDAVNAKIAEETARVEASTAATSENDAAVDAATQAKLDGLKNTGAAFKELTGTASLAAEESRKTAEATNSLGTAAGGAATQAQAQAASMQNLGQSVGELTRTMGFNATTALATKAAADETGKSWEEYKKAVTDAGISTKLLDEALKKLMGQFSQQQALDAWQSKLNGLKDSVDKNNKSLLGNTDAAIKNRGAMVGQVEKAHDVIRAMVESGASQDAVSKKVKSLADDFETQAAKAGLNKKEVKLYSDAIRKIQPEVATNVKLMGADSAITTLGKINDGLNRIPRQITSKVVLDYVSNSSLGPGYAGTTRATGGIDSAGRYVPRVSQIAKGRNILWGEPEIGGPEAYISSKKGYEARNIKILQEAASWFGLAVTKATKYATGGITGSITAAAKGATRGGSTSSRGLRIPVVATVTDIKVPASVGKLNLGVTFDEGTLKLLTEDIGSLLTGIKKPVESQAVEDVKAGFGKLRDIIKGTVTDPKKLADDLAAANKKVTDAQERIGDANAKLAEKQLKADTKRNETLQKIAAKAAKDLSTAAKELASARDSYNEAKANLSKVNGNKRSTDAQREAAQKRFDKANAKYTTENRQYTAASRANGLAQSNLKKAATASRGSMSGALGSSKAKPYLATIFAMSAKYGVPAEMIAAVIKQESGFNPNARSEDGARGLMQLMPKTFQGLGVKGSITDPRANVEAGTKYLRQQLDTFGWNAVKALAAYNAGPGAAKSGKWRGYKETTGFVRNITADKGLQAVTSSGGTVQKGASAPATVKASSKTTKAPAITLSFGGKVARLPTGNQKSGAIKVGRAVAEMFGSSIKQIGGYRAGGRYPDHPSGESWDFMVSKLGKAAKGKELQAGNVLAEYLVKNAKALGTKTVIWDGKIWSASKDKTFKPLSQWRQYSGYGGKKKQTVTTAHKDHVHWRGVGSKAAIPGLEPGSLPTSGNASVGGSAPDSAQDKINARENAEKLAEAIKERDAAKLALAVNGLRAKERDKLLKVLEKQQPKMEALALAREKTVAQLTEATASLAKLEQEAQQLQDSVASAAIAPGSLKSLFKVDTESGMVSSLGGMLDARKRAAEQAKTFATDIEALKKAGLNDTDLREVIEMGGDIGHKLAEQIKKGGTASIGELNATRLILDEEAAKLGKTASDALYKAGLESGNKLVEGLKKGADSLQAEMDRIASMIADITYGTYNITAPKGVPAPATGGAQKAPAGAAVNKTQTVVNVNLSNVTLTDANGSFLGTVANTAKQVATQVVANQTREANWRVS